MGNRAVKQKYQICKSDWPHYGRVGLLIKSSIDIPTLTLSSSSSSPDHPSLTAGLLIATTGSNPSSSTVQLSK